MRNNEAKTKCVVIVLKNGTRLELGEITLGNDKLTIYGHMHAIRDAIREQKPYISGECYIDTKEIVFMNIGEF